MRRYRCVDARKAEGFAVTVACAHAGVSASAYYEWAARRGRGPSERERTDVWLLAEIRKIHAASRGTYGSPRVTVELWRRGWRVNRKKVERMMREAGLVGHRPRRRRGLTKRDETVVGRLFDPDRPDHTWAGDSPTSPPARAGCTSLR